MAITTQPTPRRGEITITRVPVDAGEHLEREHFSQTPADRYMADGGETYQVSGLGFKKPDVEEAYALTYVSRPQTQYGNVQEIQYARNKSKTFERVIISASQLGLIDIIREDGTLKNSPNWASCEMSIALLNLQQGIRRKDWDTILPGLSKEAAAFIRDLLARK